MDMSMDPNVELVPEEGKPFLDVGRFHWLVASRTYGYQIRHLFPSEVVSQFLDPPIDAHWDVVIQMVKYFKSSTSIGTVYWLMAIWPLGKVRQNIWSSVEAWNSIGYGLNYIWIVMIEAVD